VVADILKGVPDDATLLSRPPAAPSESAIDHDRKVSCLVMVKTP